MIRSFKIYALLLLVLFPASILWWHDADSRPSSMDETRHMQLAVDYRRWLIDGVPLTDGWSHVYPPLYHLSIIPAVSLGIPSETKVALTYLFDLVMLLIGCLLITRIAGRPDTEGVLAAFLCVGFSAVFYTSRRALIDFPLMAWTTLTVALLARTNGFATRRESLLFGAAAGIGLLIKAPFIFFLWGPILFVFFRSREENKIRNLFWAFALALLIGAPWYFWQSAYFISKGWGLAGEWTANGTSPRTLSGWLYYPRLLNLQMGLASLVFTVVGIAAGLFRKSDRASGIVTAWILSGYLTLSLLVNKDMRHTLPLLPGLALLAAWGWGFRATSSWKRVLVLVAGPALLFFNMRHFDLPIKEDWKHAPIISLMTQWHDSTQPFLTASILSHHPYFFARTIKWSAFQRGVALQTVSSGDSDTSFAEFIVERPGDQGTETLVLERQWQDLKPASRAFQSLYTSGGTFVLPDQSHAILYRRNPHPRFQIEFITREQLAKHIAVALQQWVRGPLAVTVQASPQGLLDGHLDRVQLSCAQCSVKGLPLRQVDVVIEKPWLNLYRLWDENRLGLLAFESLKPSFRIEAADLPPLLAKVRGLTDANVQFKEGRVLVRARYQGIPLAAQAHVLIQVSKYPSLDAILDRISIAHIPLPGWILGKAHYQSLLLYPVPDFPGQILVNHVSIEDGELLIS